MARKKIKIDDLEDTVSKILDEYAGEVDGAVEEITRAAAKAGAAEIRENAKNTFEGTGKYAKSWTYKVERGRLYTTGVIYSNMPGLPHLLENGHAKRGGGTVKGRPHIKPVEEKLNSQYESQIVRAIT